MLSRFLYSPFLVQIVVTRYCNLSCGYCNEFDKVSPPIPTDLLKRRIDKIKELGTWAIEFTGGEPLEHPDLVELVRYSAKDKKFFKVELISNGFLFNESVVHQLNEAGLTELQISVDGVMPNETTVKVRKPLRKKLETIAKHAEFHVKLNGVIGAAPPGDVLEVIQFAEDHGLEPRVCLIHDGDGQLSLSPEQLGEYHQVKARLGKKFTEASDYRTQLVETGNAPFKCRAGSRYLYVDEAGSVRWCSQTRWGFGKPLEEYSWDDLKQQFHTIKSCHSHCTVGCVRTCSNPDRWRTQKLEAPPYEPSEQPSDLVDIDISRSA